MAYCIKQICKQPIHSVEAYVDLLYELVIFGTVPRTYITALSESNMIYNLLRQGVNLKHVREKELRNLHLQFAEKIWLRTFENKKGKDKTAKPNRTKSRNREAEFGNRKSVSVGNCEAAKLQNCIQQFWRKP